MNIYRQELLSLLYTVPAVLLAIVPHEYAHGLVSVWLGDDTPKRQGRLSLNPLHHIDFMGLICLAVFGFGWARPVQVNPRAYRNGKTGMVLVSLAGPLTNFLMAFLGCILYLLIFGKGMLLNLLSATAAAVLYQFLRMVITINLGLGLFNLIPIPPLDGSKVLGAVLPERQYFAYMRYERYGMYLLVGIMLLQNVAGITILPLGAARNALLDLMLRGAAVLTGVF